MAYSLFDKRGRRKYLVPTERSQFLQSALGAGDRIATLCAVLTLTGARISEVLALTPERIDEANGTINIETLKRRQTGITRAIPVPRGLFVLLDSVHQFREAQRDPTTAIEPLWTWSRTTAYRRVVEVMHLARIPDFLAMPKALRHAFGVEATMEGVPIPLIQTWMGHARIETTLIYTTLVGAQARHFAQRTWKKLAQYLGNSRH